MFNLKFISLILLFVFACSSFTYKKMVKLLKEELPIEEFEYEDDWDSIKNIAFKGNVKAKIAVVCSWICVILHVILFGLILVIFGSR